MTATFFQFAASGALVCLVYWVKIHEFAVWAPPRLQPWIKKATLTLLGTLALYLFIDPLIPGFARITITAPACYPTELQNLRVQVTPVGAAGEAGAERIVYRQFNFDGSVDVGVDLNILETEVSVAVYDITAPLQILYTTDVYLSPLVRRRLLSKKVSF